MSGFSDVFYKAAKERYDKQHVLPCKLSYVNTSETPDVWFTPTEVWEIRGADLTLSPVHKAAVGLLHPERGCSLRFPRFIKVHPPFFLATGVRVSDASSCCVLYNSGRLFRKQKRNDHSAYWYFWLQGTMVYAVAVQSEDLHL